MTGLHSQHPEALKRGDVINDYADYLVDDMSTYGCPITKFVPVTPLNLDENYFASSVQINYNIIMPGSDKMFEDGSYMKHNLITTLLSGRGSYFPGILLATHWRYSKEMRLIMEFLTM